jgi:hypothetical protein
MSEEQKFIVKTQDEIIEMCTKVQEMYDSDIELDEHEQGKLDGILNTLDWLIGESEELVLPEVEDGEEVKCPVCESENVDYDYESDTYTCMDCEHKFTV